MLKREMEKSKSFDTISIGLNQHNQMGGGVVERHMLML